MALSRILLARYGDLVNEAFAQRLAFYLRRDNSVLIDILDYLRIGILVFRRKHV